ncbi:MAG: HINT domain-containing protein [Bacteroidales bacterium]|nr:HINT domain-containing protein [Bacteroidales bacterium]
MNTLDQFGQPFNDLWAKLQQFGTAADDVLWAIVQDPAGFATRLAESVGQGIKDFFNGLATQLPNHLMNWLTGGLASSVPTPPENMDWGNTQQVGEYLLKFFGLDWDGIQGVVTDVLGVGNVALVTQAYDLIQTWSDTPGGVFGWLQAQADGMSAADLKNQVIDAGVNFITTNVVPKMVTKVASIFVPGGAAITGIFNTLSFLIDNMGQFAGMTDLIGTIAGKLEGVAKNQPDALTNMSNAVKTFLNGMVPIGLNFAAAQLGLGNLPQAVGDRLMGVKEYPLNQVKAAITQAAAPIKKRLELDNRPELKGAIGILAVQIGNQSFDLAVVNRNGQAEVLREDTNGQLLKFDPNRDLDPTETTALEKQALIAKLNQLKTDANALIVLMNKMKPGSGQTAHKAELRSAISTMNGELKELAQVLKSEHAVCFFGQACFSAGTPMQMPGGWQAIETIVAGDRVLSRNEHDPSAANEYKIVEEVFQRLAAVWVVQLPGGVEIRTTQEHPFQVRGKGWLPARELVVGDPLECADGSTVAVAGVVDTGEWEVVYNLRVADWHTYFVGQEEWGFAVWSHNTYYPQVQPNEFDILSAEVKYVITRAAQLRATRESEINNGTRDAFRFSANYMVITVETPAGVQTHWEIGTRGKRNHSEPKLLAWMRSVGATKVIAAFSEHVPCDSCSIVAADMRALVGPFKLYYAVNIAFNGIASNQSLHDWWHATSIYTGP